MSDTQRNALPLDIRCTDTDTTPNSVLLVGSKGDLFTEGYAHDGKVLLYQAGAARPDQIRALWPHIDRFGHARRYLNWNPWFFDGASLENVCYQVPIASSSTEPSRSVVETEVKHVIPDIDVLDTLLRKFGFIAAPASLQRDEYFDTDRRVLSSMDYVVRLRSAESKCVISLKGPRFYTDSGAYSRIELEVQAATEDGVRAMLASRGLRRTWYFEKRRVEYTKPGAPIVAVDEIPEIGYFAEIEGDPEAVAGLTSQISTALGERATRNYKELSRTSTTSAPSGLSSPTKSSTAPPSPRMPPRTRRATGLRTGRASGPKPAPASRCPRIIRLPRSGSAWISSCWQICCG